MKGFTYTRCMALFAWTYQFDLSAMV